VIGADECADVEEVERGIVVVVNWVEGLDGDFLVGVDVV